MKKSEFIQKVLDHDFNTIFVEKEQVGRALMMFEDLGMLAPSHFNYETEYLDADDGDKIKPYYQHMWHDSFWDKEDEEI
tara:strand:+ start:2169 stop:2405 length:237 start_codon:yes stop_codon:yes gene_type:complete